MKKLFLTSLILFLVGFGNAQPLAGTKSIPGNYATIQLAIADLNTHGVGSGGVVFNVAAGHTETFSTPTAGLITATGTSSDHIVFQKSGTGANPLITAGIGTSTSTDGIIKLAGTDYITFDGINLQENSGNLTNTKRMEWGYALVKKQATSPIDGCQFVVIKNCKITLTKNSASKGIYSGNHIATATSNVTITATTDAHNDCQFFSDSIVNCMEPISLNGFNASTPYNLYDQNNEVGVDGGNIISGVGGPRGIFAIYQNNLKIANNNITEPAAITTELSGIYTSTANAAKISIYSNTISVKNSSSSSSTVYGIKCYSGSNAVGSVVRISNNQVQNSGFTGSASLAFYGIDIGAAPDSAYIYNNSVVNNAVPGSGTFTGINISASTGPTNLSIFFNTISGNQKTGAGGILYGIKTTFSKVRVYSNNIYNNAIPTSSGTTSPAQIIGYYNEYSPPAENIYLNNIYNLAIGGSNTHGSTAIYGMYSYSSGSKNIYSNTIHGLSSHKGVVTGISSLHGDTVRIFRNNIYDLYSIAGDNTSTSVKGIEINETGHAYIYNNFISDLKTTSASHSNAIVGIFQGLSFGMWQTLSLFYNTIYLNAISTGSTFGTSAFYCSNTLEDYYFAVVMNNNIFVNVSTPNGSGLTVAHRRNGSLLLGYSYNSNNNDFYAGTPAPNHLLFYDGTYGLETLNEYQNWVSPTESRSFSENPPFINSDNAPYDLHLDSPDANLFESGGIVVSAPISITDDFDTDPRYPNSGYPDITAHPAKAPDVGADEFASIRLDLVPPVIEFTALPMTSSLLERTLTATITDDYSGVPVSGTGLPRLYWRIKHGVPGSWQNTQGVSEGNDQYAFSFGAGVVEHDTVDYYIVAQDLAPTPNVSTSAGYSGEFTSDPPACVDMPYDFDAYFIMGNLCGTFNVGAGQTYETITEAINGLSNNIVTCPITFLLTDEEYPSESLPLTFNSYPWSDVTKTVTIKPAPGVTPHIYWYTGYAIFWLNGAGFVTIDGSNTQGGTDRSLTIENLYGNNAASAIRLSNEGNNSVQHCTIKNCILIGGSRVNTNYGIYASDGGYHDITIQNNEFLNATTGFSLGGNTENVSSQWIITKNIFGNPVDDLSLGYAGIETKHADGFIISENVIQNIKSDQENAYGMIIGQNVVNTSIIGNRITGIKYTSDGGFGGKGIDINTGNSVSNILVANNVVSDISGDGWDYLSGDAIAGIRILGSTGGVDLYYNSVDLSGQIHGNNTGNLSAAVFVDGGATSINMSDNIFRNSIVDTAYEAYAYSIVSFAPYTAFTGINYNDYFTDGPDGVLGYLDNAVSTLAEWQTATGQDNYSRNEDPLFISATDLHPQTGSPVLGAGVPITGIDEDFSGDPRNSTNPSMGAYENGLTSSNKTLNLTLFLEGLYAGSGTMNQAYDDMGPHFGDGIADQVTVELHNATDYATIEYTSGPVDLSTTGNIAIHTIPNSFGDSYYLTIKHRNSIETTTANPVNFSGTPISYTFDAQAKAYGSNMGFITDGVAVIYTGDENQDQIVDGTDLSEIGNLADVAASGYLPQDINGDGLVDGSDLSAAGNNADVAVGAVLP